jgi:hypothetical protein
MFHPLSGDVEELTDQELSDKMQELTKKLNQSYRMGNAHLANQINMIMQEYREERMRRDREMMKKLQEQAEGKDKFGESIDIS